MSKYTDLFLEKSGNLFKALKRLSLAGASVIDVQFDERTIKIEKPDGKQMTLLGFQAAFINTFTNRCEITLYGFTITWKAEAEIMETTYG